ncbi:zinc ribbon domain-containing protein [Oribacterium sp. WCC10]|uniref:zinc ribbon domain-containing protein n=1 Tax=Oribacterium sp. WCC10 TaxID=1855343 RepID=UPI0008EA9599|nr:zinc ribbon domain-containing protein [Oribacterium sp. WCC10]SFG15023.1 Putative cell wall binding repeat-containing protein [Oribacterium sp. WCC10]
MSKFCENCGAKLPDDAMFCENCGAKVDFAADNSVNDSMGGHDAGVNNNGSSWQSSSSNVNFQGSYRPEGGPAPSSTPPGGSGGFTQGPGVPNGNYYQPPAKKGGFPVVIFAGIGAAVVLLAGGFAAFNLLKGGGDKGVVTQETIAKESSADKTGSSGGKGNNSETGGAKSDVKDSSAKDTGDASKLKVPSGVTIKEDAKLADLIGEYEGEMQVTVCDGYESVEGVPDDFEEEKKKAMAAPVECTLEIDKDGNWNLEWDFMGGMSFDSDEYDDPNELTDEQIKNLRISEVADGIYHARLSLTGDVDGELSEMHIDHIGAYCISGSDKQIVGNMLMIGKMSGAEVTVGGDFTVKKTTEDVKPDENGNKGKGSGKDKIKKNEELLKGAKNSNSGKNSKEKETEPETEAKREIGTITGGQWTKMKSGAWIYEKNGRLVKDTWVQDKGKYYYIDEDGYMMTNGYTPDGYYVKSDGSWDPDVKQLGQEDSKKSSGNDPSENSITGGEWDYLQDGAVLYMDSRGEYVSDQWVEYKGKYYYLGPDETLIKNNYSTDGYWLDENGAWSKSVPRRNDDPALKNGSYVGNVSTWKIKLQSGNAYGKATFSYTSFGGKEEYTLESVGHGVYIATSDDESDFKALMSVSSDGKTLTVSQAGITEECKLK